MLFLSSDLLATVDFRAGLGEVGEAQGPTATVGVGGRMTPHYKGGVQYCRMCLPAILPSLYYVFFKLVVFSAYAIFIAKDIIRNYIKNFAYQKCKQYRVKFKW